MIGTITTHRQGAKAPCAESESPFLAMKKFSLATALGLATVRQNRFWRESQTADSERPDGRAVTMNSEPGGERRSIRAS
ncbi:hypothetical protein [Bradyrhizobium sp. dw_78]|uniref:hypothetical protein n=1 Tax=Bradyrhizobium sp. dw_78 TaxID=2719793 RepID=UPI001BD5224E|nr:hypothetical protein [Bradyrhizobium sp. dw_78]